MAAATAGGPPDPSLPPVSLKAERISRNESLIRTALTTDSDAVRWSFATSSNSLVPTVTRLESSWTRRLEGSGTHLGIGDTVSVPGAWGNPVRFAGVQVGTRMDQRADIVPVTRLATPGIATLPSSVDALFSSAGVKSLANQGLSVDGKVQIAEANTVSFVARDSLGRKLKVTQPLLTAAPLVERGCGDYSVGLGRVREDFALASNTYGELFANTRVLCGFRWDSRLKGMASTWQDREVRLA